MRKTRLVWSWLMTAALAAPCSTIAVADNRCKGQLAHHSDVNDLAFSPNGKVLVSASNDGTIKLWALPSGKLLRRLKGSRAKGYVRAVAFHPNGRVLVSGSTTDLRFWALPKGRALASHQANEVRDVALSPDGRWIVSAHQDGTLRRWSTKTRRPEKTLKGHSALVLTVAIDPGSKILVSGSSDRTLRIWSLGSGDMIRTVRADDFVRSVVVSTGKVFMSDDRGKVEIRRLVDGKLLRRIGLSWGKTDVLAIDSRHALLAAGGRDRLIRLVSLPKAKLLHTLSGHGDRISALAFSSTGKWLASAGDDDQTIRLWTVPEGRFVKCLADPRVRR